MEEDDQKILEAALGLFQNDNAPTGMIEAADICEAAQISVDQFLDLFQGAGQVLSLSYILLLDQAEESAAAITGFELLAFEEKLATFCFVLLDVFEQNERFVSATFSTRAAGVLSPFQQQMRDVISRLLKSPDVSSVNRAIFDNPLTRIALSESVAQLVQKWIDDDSQDRERSTAFVDRVVGWWAELITNGIPEKSVDLLRYSVEAGYLPVDKLPVIRDWLKTDAE